MTKDIEAIFFDMGTTLRTRVADEALRWQAMEQLTALLGEKGAPAAFYERLAERYQAYRQWAQETLIEASEREIWTHWMLPEWPSEQIEPLAEQLTDLWRRTQGRRTVRPDARLVVAELARRGYHLGLISNTTSTRAVPRGLEEYGLAEYFDTVILSCVFGRRKPDPAIFWEATRRLDVSPSQSAYVGDQISRDVVGPRRAGFAMAIIVDNPRAREQAQEYSAFKPDVVIQELSELLDIFGCAESEIKP
jgi:putative hydrolase of the HAD superfamily